MRIEPCVCMGIVTQSVLFSGFLFMFINGILTVGTESEFEINIQKKKNKSISRNILFWIIILVTGFWINWNFSRSNWFFWLFINWLHSHTINNNNNNNSVLFSQIGDGDVITKKFREKNQKGKNRFQIDRESSVTRQPVGLTNVQPCENDAFSHNR